MGWNQSGGALAMYVAMRAPCGIALPLPPSPDDPPGDRPADPAESDYDRFYAAVIRFDRHDAADSSTLSCPCGAKFTWNSRDDRLFPWVEEHAPHTMRGDVA